MAGSCFTDNVGGKLAGHGFEVTINPTGNVYNPVSLGVMLEGLVHGRQIASDELFEHDGLWHNFDFHTRFSASDPAQTLRAMNEAMRQGAEALRNASHVILTLGTSFVYTNVHTGRPVANCHKLPASTFVRERLTVDECVDALRRCLDAVSSINPEADVILTVSPIRHVADGLHQNQLSKSTLLLAVDRLISLGHKINTAYFPSFELLTDDLRDYRFYAQDMVHPSDAAIEYIWERFVETYMSRSTIEEGRRRRKDILRASHRPIAETTGNNTYYHH